MLKLAVLGSPINHSLSPRIHQAAYELMGVAASYERFEVDEDSFKDFIETHQDWNGFSLTMPLKAIGMDVCGFATSTAKKISAVNTLVSKDGIWNGHNTDVLGFDYLLKNMDLRDVAILGAGGTAKAALYALAGKEIGARVYRRSTNRDAQLLNANSRVEILPWDEIGDAFSATLLVNTLPITAFDAEIKALKPRGDVLDSLYHPWPTPLSQSTDPSRYSSGKDLLVAQALFQIELFSNTSIDKDEFFKRLRALI